jgi:F-type H+-transporting ATPase subunit epsilon
MAAHLRVRLVTPERILMDTDAEAVEIPGKTGYLEVLYGHAPLLTEIGAGMVRLHGAESGRQSYLIARGFAEVLPERVTILAEEADKPEAIDTAAAQEQLEHGQELWDKAGDDPAKYTEANELMAEASAKLESAGKS